jgi:endogenous inhibitor of DNA gyrase (YacG/DUF329 family)
MRFKCPGCGEEMAISGREEASCFPFCGPRCRMADLDRWFTEDYKVPGDPVDGMPTDALNEEP